MVLASMSFWRCPRIYISYQICLFRFGLRASQPGTNWPGHLTRKIPRGPRASTESLGVLSSSSTVVVHSQSSIDRSNDRSIISRAVESPETSRMDSLKGCSTNVGQDRCACRRKVSFRRQRATFANRIYSIAGVMLVFNTLGMDRASAFMSPNAKVIGSLSACLSGGELRSTTSETDHQLRLKLESMTIRELRDVLKASPDLNKKGTLSRLKLKKDLVEYLRENLRSPPSENLMAMEKTTRTSPVSMPAAEGKLKASLSAREASIERTYQQYPPLRNHDFCSGIGEDDVRQRYHPIFHGEQSQLTGDMDIVFMGTASCTPGISRGVSCTALRLNWNRHAAHGLPGAVEESVRAFNGGTWLFDVGECTQVCAWIGIE
jgi:hypothetical protein